MPLPRILAELGSVHRITMIEKNFAALREGEEASRQEEVVMREQERLEGIKKKELARITNERRRENERRRTQEIKFNREDFEQMRATQVHRIVNDGLFVNTTSPFRPTGLRKVQVEAYLQLELKIQTVSLGGLFFHN